MPSPLISLPMYSGSAAVETAFWHGLRDHLRQAGLGGVPEELAMPEDFEAHWNSPHLLLSQTCGYPLTHHLQGKVQLVGVPCYAAPGCEGAFYRSVVILREDDPAETLADLRGHRAAFNSMDSQSGYNALRALVAVQARGGRFFGATIETGTHKTSVDLVRRRLADVASIDCVTYALLAQETPAAVEGLRIFGFTAKAPSPPLITSLATLPADVERLRAAFAAACADPALAEARQKLLLSGFEPLALEAYEICNAMEREAIALGYPELA
jgi:ABC-type phosphate/phosphonate transport system substrate-binding protein